MGPQPNPAVSEVTGRASPSTKADKSRWQREEEEQCFGKQLGHSEQEDVVFVVSLEQAPEHKETPCSPRRDTQQP